MNLIPEQARIVYDGIDYKVYQYDQELSDWTLEVAELIRWKDSAKIIMVRDNKIMIWIEEKSQKWQYYTLLGGRLNRHEQVIEWAQRELLEETWMVSHDMKHLLTLTRKWAMKFDIHILVTHDFTQISDPVFKPWEKIKLKEVTFDEFVQIVISDKFRWEEFKEKIKILAKDTNTLKEFQKLLFW